MTWKNIPMTATTVTTVSNLQQQQKQASKSGPTAYGAK